MKAKKGRYSGLLRPILTLIDLLVINLLILVCLRSAMSNFGYHTILSFFWLIIAYYSGFYEVYRHTKLASILLKIVRQFFFIWVITFAYVGFKYKYVTTTEILNYILVCSLSVGLLKFSVFFLLKKYRLLYKGNIRRIVVIGNGKNISDLIDYFYKNPDLGYDLLKKYEVKNKSSKDINDILEDLNNFKTEEIYASLNDIKNNDIEKLIDYSDNNLITLKLVPDNKSSLFRNFAVEYYGFIPIISLRTIPLDKSINERFKRTFDIIFSLIVILLVLSWLTPLLGLLIKIESNGPVFFKQNRPGIKEQDFWCYKFRSMKINKTTEKEATRNDPRVTKLGRFMRKTSIDELPQFFNVLLGDMSVVGPRPHLWSQNKNYGARINKYMMRHHVRPGVTGMAQVNGYRGEIETDDDMINRIKYDIYYIENWSIWMDLKIIFQTVVNIFKGEEKAY